MSARRKNPAQLVILGNPRSKRGARKKANGHRASCNCPICKNIRGRRGQNAGDQWMAAAFAKHPGKLHKRLGVPEGQTIPLSLLFSKLRAAKKADDTELEREILLALNARRYAGRRRNPADQPVPDEFAAAVAAYEQFHGRAPDKVLRVQRSAAMRADYVDCGPLLALGMSVPGLAIPSPDKWDTYPHLKFSGVKLARNAEGTQLYAIGGDQDCSGVLEDFQNVDASKDILTLGEIAFVVYLARKRPDPTHPTEYMHPFDTPRPELGYDQVKREIFFIGGTYRVGEWIEG